MNEPNKNCTADKEKLGTWNGPPILDCYRYSHITGEGVWQAMCLSWRAREVGCDSCHAHYDPDPPKAGEVWEPVPVIPPPLAIEINNGCFDFKSSPHVQKAMELGRSKVDCRGFYCGNPDGTLDSTISRTLISVCMPCATFYKDDWSVAEHATTAAMDEFNKHSHTVRAPLVLDPPPNDAVGLSHHGDSVSTSLRKLQEANKRINELEAELARHERHQFTRGHERDQPSAVALAAGVTPKLSFYCQGEED